MTASRRTCRKIVRLILHLAVSRKTDESLEGVVPAKWLCKSEPVFLVDIEQDVLEP